MTTEPLAPLTDARVRELMQLERSKPDVAALAQEVARSRAKLGFPLAPPGDPAYIEAPGTDCVICFDDPDQGIAVFTGAGAESAARRRLEELRQNWTCHLFVSPGPRDERIADLEAENARLQSVAVKFLNQAPMEGDYALLVLSLRGGGPTKDQRDMIASYGAARKQLFAAVAPANEGGRP